MVGSGALSGNSLGSKEGKQYWRINGDPVATDPIEEIRTFDTLELTVQVPLEAVQQVLRPLRPNAGAVAVLDRSDGGFVAVDTADGNNTLELESPANRQDVRRQLEWHVADYDEEMLDREGEKFEVELELVPSESKRQYSGHEDEAAGEEDWLFEFDAGDVATAGVSSEIIETHSDGVETLSLMMTLTGQQVRKVEESARKLSAVRISDQFDGQPRAEDNSPTRVNTFQLTPPDGGDKTIDPGEYVVLDWETEWRSENAYDVSIEVATIPATTDFAADDFADDDFATTQ